MSATAPNPKENRRVGQAVTQGVVQGARQPSRTDATRRSHTHRRSKRLCRVLPREPAVEFALFRLHRVWSLPTFTSNPRQAGSPALSRHACAHSVAAWTGSSETRNEFCNRKPRAKGYACNSRDAVSHTPVPHVCVSCTDKGDLCVCACVRACVCVCGGGGRPLNVKNNNKYPDSQSCAARKPRLDPPEEVRDRTPGNIAYGFCGAVADDRALVFDSGSDVAQDVPCGLEHQIVGVVDSKHLRRRGAASEFSHPRDLVEAKPGHRAGGWGVGGHSTQMISASDHDRSSPTHTHTHTAAFLS